MRINPSLSHSTYSMLSWDSISGCQKLDPVPVEEILILWEPLRSRSTFSFTSCTRAAGPRSRERVVSQTRAFPPITACRAIHSLADLRGGEERLPPLYSNRFHFYAVFGKGLPSNRLALSGVGATLWEILDPPLTRFQYKTVVTNPGFLVGGRPHYRMAAAYFSRAVVNSFTL